MSESGKPLVGKRSRHRLRNASLFIVAVAMIVVPTSFKPVRTVLAYPLFVNEPNAEGDAAYVMADGYAFWKRLRAASDLFNMGRVPTIYLLIEDDRVGYDFVGKQSETRTQRGVRYLKWHGVPESAIKFITVDGTPAFGSLSEARAFAELSLPDLSSVVVVTSAPHTRRSKLCFQRSLPDDVRVQSYAASDLASSTELYEPIWIEYIKLVVYYFVA
tara:strand:+ start:15890 stop:16537 length:648 start_codon:yes stop_codon:yes gene_type:complete